MAKLLIVDDSTMLRDMLKDLVNNSTSYKAPVKIDFEKLYSVDEIVSGKVERIVDFGAFILLAKYGMHNTCTVWSK